MIGFSLRTRNAIAEAIRATISGRGPGNAMLLFDGERPLPDDPAGAEPIVLVQIPRDNMVTAKDGEWTSGVLPVAIASRNGKPTWGRIVDGSGNAVMDFDVGVGRDLDIGEESLEAGDPVVVDDLRIGV